MGKYPLSWAIYTIAICEQLCEGVYIYIYYVPNMLKYPVGCILVIYAIVFSCIFYNIIILGYVFFRFSQQILWGYRNISHNIINIPLFPHFQIYSGDFAGQDSASSEAQAVGVHHLTMWGTPNMSCITSFNDKFISHKPSSNN